MSDGMGALAALTVVDLTSGVGGAYAGKLLADLGAKVVMVEPPGGSPLRRRPPFAPGAAEGAIFQHLAGGKESVLSGEDDVRPLLASLLWQGDVLLVDGASPWEAALPGATPEHLVVVDLSPFGRHGPYAGWRSSDIALWALGGYMYFTGAPDREPVWLPGSQADLHAGAHAAFAALVGVYERRRSGHGQRVEVSALESVLTAHAWLASSWAGCGQVLPRVESDVIRAADGWIYAMRIYPTDNIFILIDRLEMIDENLTADYPTWAANIPRIFAAVAEWAADKNVDEIVEFAQELRVAVTPVLDAAGVSADPQLAARDWWEREGDMLFPGQPYHFSASPARRQGPAPALGAHTASVAASAASAALPLRPAATAPGLPPLSGLRVVEVTNNWAGPVCGRFLADLGAHVVKVEWPTRPPARGLFWAGPAQDLQRQGYNRSLYFNEMNRNKEDAAVDLGMERGREVFLDLVRQADVLIENNSARVMPNLGLDWEHLREVNPRLVMVSMSGYGATGPRRDWSAFGSNIETTSGLTSITGYPDGQMSRTTLFYADPVAGVHGAVAVMAALEHRHHTGEGQFVDMSLNESGVAFCCEALLDYHATGTVRSPAGNRDPRFAPQGAYPCIGVDHWVAITVEADDDWPVLAAAMSRPDLASDPRLQTLSGRHAHHDEIDECITAWTSQLEQYEVAWELQRRGLSAAPVLANWQVLADPHIHRRGFYQTVEHPVVGVYPTSTWPWHFTRTPARIVRPAPLFAEHNRLVLGSVGLDDAAVDELYSAGVTADQPIV